MLNAMNISASGLSLNQLQMDVISNNIANANTTRTANGGPYRREMVVAAPSFQDTLQGYMNGNNQVGTGVQAVGIVQDGSPFRKVYDPTSPDAVNGYVEMPNVDISQEMTDMMSAIRSYEANQTAFDASKQMSVDSISLGK